MTGRMSDHPVTVTVQRPDGSIEHVRVGTATRQGDGFVLRLGELSIGGTPVSAASTAAQADRRPIAASGSGMTLPNYGRAKGQPIAGASMGDLEYYANGARRSLGDPSKSRWHDKERTLLAAIEAEIARQKGGLPPMPSLPGDDDAPPRTDDDVPF